MRPRTACSSPPPAADPLYSPTNAAGQVEVILKDHRFSPAEIHVPAGKRIELLIKRTRPPTSSTRAPSVSKVISGGKEFVVRLRALDPGRYPFMGEFNAATVQGVVVAE